MARVIWQIQENDYRTYGYGMTGYETAGGNIPSTGTFSFTGEGEGYDYKVSSNDVNPSNFTVTANVDFATRTISLATDNYDNNNNYLNMTGTLNYAAGVNNISGNVETAGDGSNPKMTGTAIANFYGPAVEGFGGTFSVSNATAGYMGWFGAQESDDTTITTHADTPTTFNANNLTGFNDSNRNGTTGNALQAPNMVQITKQFTGDKTVTNENILGAVVEFDYASDGQFADGDDNLILYFADKKYSTTNGTGQQDSIRDISPIADDDPDQLWLYQK